MSDAKPKYVGRSVLRKEDGPLLRGLGRFAADINFQIRNDGADGRLTTSQLSSGG